ncbi:hypothetical protein [Klebsiella pneumoniae ISC21]|nr:hypothetical protein [Klebsiella pneumoniae ISC21]
MQINDNFTYHLMGMRLICQYFYKSWKNADFSFLLILCTRIG